MRNLKLTINELKTQKDALKRFERYLPTLILKKQNVQIELFRIKRTLQERLDQERRLMQEMDQWIAVLGEDAGIGEMIKVDAVEREETNVAGVDIPHLKRVRFEEIPYDFYTTPLWFDRAVTEIKGILTVQLEIRVLREQVSRLEEELRITTQRVNLFEKVKIPETRENIRVIQIFLGDQQTAAVVRGKISKEKTRRKAEMGTA